MSNLTRVLNALAIGALAWVVIAVPIGSMIALIATFITNRPEALDRAFYWLVFAGPLTAFAYCPIGIPVCALVVFFVHRSRQRRRTSKSS